ncbi:hypothetical protein E2562_009533 [Oryza meyeriana var. granulata]|uniref:Uncharacterized protein n=1 Tax=Oryza meyeriana var. granulata TaxID=110450 RepID=A0A6G1F5S2_9ORYZ|nr:hypothetical protein E2562_009533 [Oryza meyeriana var. granulata]
MEVHLGKLVVIVEIKKGIRVFKKSPLKYIDLHNAVFQGWTVVGDYSNVAGSQADSQQLAQ